jgi:tetratricopeptide (TPR) repeat protein
MARLFEETGRIDQARVEFERACEAESSAQSYMNLGMFFKRSGEHESAMRAFEKALTCENRSVKDFSDLDSEFIQAGGLSGLRFLYAQACFDSDRLNESRKALLDIVCSNEETGRANYLLGRIYEIEGNSENALLYFNKALEMTPDDFDIILSMGKMMTRARDFKSALEIFKKSEDKVVNDSLAAYYYGKCLVNQGEYEKGLEILVNVEKSLSSEADLKYYKGLALENLGRPNEAVIEYRQALSIQENHLESLKRLAELLVGEDEKIERKDVISYLLKQEPDLNEYREIMARILLENEDYKAAEQELLIICANKPDDLKLKYDLARCHSRLGKMEDAIVLFKKILVHEPDNYEVRYHLGLSFNSLARIDEAVEEYKKVLETAPEESSIYKSASEMLKPRRINIMKKEDE